MWDRKGIKANHLVWFYTFSHSSHFLLALIHISKYLPLSSNSIATCLYIPGKYFPVDYSYTYTRTYTHT